MSSQKPSIPRGTRDFGPEKMIKRNFILNTIQTVFKKFGFLQIETPSMEQLSVLSGKYGEEGDQLIFKILNSGNYLENINTDFIIENHKKLTPQIAEKALRYDLTVPFARFVVMNKNEITFPFKRYQIQPVWRADKPQKGRYREFYQCDADVVGTNSLLCETEIISMITEVFQKLNINDYTIKINHRKILQGIASAIGKDGQESSLCVAIDKLDKIGIQGVSKELLEKGYTDSEIEKLLPIFNLKGNTLEIIEQLKIFLDENPIGNKGIEEILSILDILESMNANFQNITLDLSLARGLSYYTGTIFEVKVNNIQMGSVSGGGRYDNLTEIFGLPNISGVGISFGVDRLYDVLEELQLFPSSSEQNTQILITYFDQEGFRYGLNILPQLRAANISSELYPDSSKIKKQFEYADKKKIPYVAIIGEEEMIENKISIKNMLTGTQERYTLQELILNFSRN
ncbi:MAG: histidine--tRNA ligase [Cytophagales bacterium]|nr:MAG: histidine--tRNA ligase [Cytophagales bacterium]